jgi:hypothetical protein
MRSQLVGFQWVCSQLIFPQLSLVWRLVGTNRRQSFITMMRATTSILFRPVLASCGKGSVTTSSMFVARSFSAAANPVATSSSSQTKKKSGMERLAARGPPSITIENTSTPFKENDGKDAKYYIGVINDHLEKYPVSNAS